MKNTQAYYPLLLIILSIGAYVYLGYGIERENFTHLVTTFGLVFTLYLVLVNKYENSSQLLLLAFILFRIVFVFYTPSLSQDYFRFIWDGRLLAQGVNPYLFVPKDLVVNPDFVMAESRQLYDGMGALSAKHYSNYPPVNQFCFWLAGVLSSKSIFGGIITLRLILILADIGVLFFGKKILDRMGYCSNRIYFYLLNPLIIVELTGNLHFEGLMLFFLIWSMYLLQQFKWKRAALVFGLSISAKLLPLILIPVFFKKLKFKKFVVFGSIAIGINVLLFLPFISAQLITNYTTTIGLWFTNFEFNASLYYVVRYIGYQIVGYNVIQTIGRFTPFLVIVMVALFSLLKKNNSIATLFNTMLLVLTCYFFLSTTVHPWYIISLVVLSVFTIYNYAYIWSGMVVLSYYAYSNPEFKENYWLIGIQYGVVVAVFLYEVLRKRKQVHLNI